MFSVFREQGNVATSSFSDLVRMTGADLVGLLGDEFASSVNRSLASLFPAFAVGGGVIYDAKGSRVIVDSLIATAPIQNGEVSADQTAVAAIVGPNLDVADLRSAYARIRSVKALEKAKPMVRQQTATLGLILAANSSLSLDDISGQIRSLNRDTADEHRPDMVAVLSRGTVNYGMQFFTDSRVGMMSPPDPDAAYIPPVLVSLSATSTKDYALNKLVALVIGHLAFFAPGMALPSMKDVLEGVSSHGSVACTYQYDLSHRLVEVAEPPKPCHPYVIEDDRKNRLLKLAFQQWSDGGVVVAEGKMPLTGVLLLAGVKLPLDTFSTSEGRQLSSILRMDANGFVNMMSQVAKRSRGMKVRREAQTFTMTKWVDEGTASPFGARILMTPLTVRDAVLTDKRDLARFDEIYQFIMNHLIDLRGTLRALERLWNEHSERVRRGEAAAVAGAIHVSDPIDQPFFKFVRDMIMDAARVAKKMQKLTAIFGVDTGFVFQKRAQFERSVEDLKAADPSLAAYLLENRKWLEPLRLMRDEIEHGTFSPPKLRYVRVGDGGLRVEQPTISGLSVTDYFALLLSRLNRFVEEVLMWCIQQSLDTPQVLVEVPVANRDPDKVERFKISFGGQAELPWKIVYSDDHFDRV